MHTDHGPCAAQMYINPCEYTRQSPDCPLVILTHRWISLPCLSLLCPAQLCHSPSLISTRSSSLSSLVISLPHYPTTSSGSAFSHFVLVKNKAPLLLNKAVSLNIRCVALVVLSSCLSDLLPPSTLSFCVGHLCFKNVLCLGV